MDQTEKPLLPMLFGPTVLQLVGENAALHFCIKYVVFLNE